MGNGMNKILPGLFVGNFRDAKDVKQLDENKITHILSIHDNAKKVLEDKEYLCIDAADNSDQDLSQFFPQCIKFIHKARLEGGGVLVHCLAGVSRSVTVTAAYIMTITELGWRDSLNSIRGARSVANPNFGFQKQLQHYDNDNVREERKKLKKSYPENPFDDEGDCRVNIHTYQQYLMAGTPTSASASSSNTYSLPYKAYQKKDATDNKSSPDTDKDKEKDEPSSQKEGGEEEGGIEEENTDSSSSGGKKSSVGQAASLSDTYGLEKRQSACLDDL